MLRVVVVFCAVAVFVINAAEIRTCVCNKDDTKQLPVLNSTDVNPFVIGYLNPRQCRLFVNTLATNSSWLIIEINDVQGYISQSSDFILIAECPGPGGAVATGSPYVPTNSPTNGTNGCVTPPITNGLKGDVSHCPVQVVKEASANCNVLTQHGHSCYEVAITRITWGHAQNVCKKRGGHLVTVHNAAENQYIHSIVSQINHTRAVWIGLEDKTTEGHFHWVTGEKMTFHHFSNHSIHDAHGPNNLQDCVVMKSTGLWEDVHCGIDAHHTSANITRHSYVCEYKVHNFGTNIVG